VVDTIDYAYDAAGRQTKLLRGATVLSERAFNPDGTLLWRKDGDNAALGQSGFTYDWAQRLKTVDLPDAQFSTAVPTFSWRLDGLIGGRTWSGSSATFGYDAAKRVTSLAKGSLSFSQAYDRDANVTSEGRTLTGVSGDPGTGTQSFSYDALGRVTGSSGLASGSRTYTYDRDGNRLTKVEGGSTYTYTYDRTDQLINVLKTGGSAQSFGYDAFGNMTIDAQSGLTITTMAYDLDDHLTGIDASGGTANDASFTLDALGRFRTRVIAAGTETYSYVEGSETVARIAGPGATNTDSILSPAGDRLGVRVSTTVNWFLPDLHGSVAGSLDATEATVVNAIRYDAWGQTISTGTAGGTRVGDKAWKYQGRLDISPDALATPLYEMSARFYLPGLGTFTQLDTYAGTAQNPLSMNRFLYAHSNADHLHGSDGPLDLRGRLRRHADEGGNRCDQGRNDQERQQRQGEGEGAEEEEATAEGG
jgi:RHS repeat-associated protein